MPPMSKSFASLSQTPPAPRFIERLSAFTQALIDKEKWVFGCEQQVFTAEQVATPDYLFPLVLHRAARWMQEGYGEMAPMHYRLSQEPLPGRAHPPLCAAVPEMDAPTASLTVWALFIAHTLTEWVGQHADLVARKEPVPLDSWYQEWLADLDEGKLVLLPAKPRQLLEPQGPERASPLSPVLPARANPVG